MFLNPHQGCNVEKEIQLQHQMIQTLEVELIHHVKVNDIENIEKVEKKIEQCDENIKRLRSKSDQMLSELVIEEKTQCTKKKKTEHVENLEHNLQSQLESVKQEIQEEEINQYFNNDVPNKSHFALVMTALKTEEEKILEELSKIQKIKQYE
eukprot:gene2187-2051_t